MGRSRNTALILVLQNAGDLLSEQVTNCLSGMFAFRSTVRGVAGDFAYTSGNALVDENANEVWSALVCKPLVYGELGTIQYNPAGQPPAVVNTCAGQLLWAQAIAANETRAPR